MVILNLRARSKKARKLKDKWQNFWLETVIYSKVKVPGQNLRAARFSRRRFLAAALLASPFLAIADSKWLEPTWVKTRRVRLGQGKPRHRFVHFTDVHHKGNRAYLESV